MSFFWVRKSLSLIALEDVESTSAKHASGVCSDPESSGKVCIDEAVGELCLKAKSTNESDKEKSMFLNPRPVVMRPSVQILCGSSEYA